MYDINALCWEMKNVAKNNFGVYATKADAKKCKVSYQTNGKRLQKHSGAKLSRYSQWNNAEIRI